jgi:CzcA family heavy metal efflux pump
MVNQILKFSLENRIFVLIIGMIIISVGAFISRDMEVDIFPDLNAPTVVIMTDAHGMAPEEVERSITFIIESAMNGAPEVRRVRSNSTLGFSIVWIEFDWGTDIFRARQTVNERLSTLLNSLPPGVSTPILAPQTSLLGEIMIFAMTSDSLSAMDLKTYADWQVRPRLLSLGGVAYVTVMGGDSKHYLIAADPEKMRYYDVSMNELQNACNEMNINSAGGFFSQYGNEYVIRGIGRTNDINELGNILIKSVNGLPVKISDVAEVKIDAHQKINDASYNTQESVVFTLTKQPKGNTIQLTEKVIQTLDEIKSILPGNVQFHTEVFNQADFINIAISNVTRALIEGGIFVIVILFIFLLSVRTTFISLLAIPLSLFTSIIVLQMLGLTINTMSLGGMAIAIGSLVDDAIIDVENVFKRLKENALMPEHEKQKSLKVVYEASKEIRASIINATMIIIVTFIPLFFLTGMEGRMLQPLGISFIVALFASLVVSITITPVLCSYLLTNPKTLSSNINGSALVRFLTGIYEKIVRFILPKYKIILTVSALLFLITLISNFYLGRNFLPPFNEGSLTINLATLPGTSLEQSTDIARQAEKLLMTIPEVVSVTRKTGRAELSEHSFGSSISEIEVPFLVDERTRNEFLKDVRNKLSSINGVIYHIGQPISHKIDHIISGSKTSIAIKLYGTDLDRIYRLANVIRNRVVNIEGVVDLSVEQLVNVPQLLIKADRDKLQSYGITMNNFHRLVDDFIAGSKVGQVIEADRTFDIVLRIDESNRNNIEAIKSIYIDTDSGNKVMLSDVAEVITSKSVNSINRENVKRRIVISANAFERDLKSLIEEIKSEIDKIPLPENYYVEYGGQFEVEEQASRVLFLASILAIIIVFFILYQEFRSFILAAIILINLPLSLIGGIATVWITSGTISIPTIIGFITLFGIATRNGILLVSRYKKLINDGNELKESIIIGSMDRLNPILMTALSAALALIPLVIAGDKPGNEIQSPMAEVILGGLLSSTFLNLIVIPAAFYAVFKKFGYNKIFGAGR